MKNILYVTLREHKILFRDEIDTNIQEYVFKNIKHYPNVPFYVQIFDNPTIIKDVQRFLKSTVYSIRSRLFKPKSFILINDDTIGFEKKAIEEFMMLIFGVNKVYLGMQCAFVGPKGINTYVSISQSSRMIILTYIKDRDIEAQKFIYIQDYSAEEIQSMIDNLHHDCKPNKLNLYLNGTDLKKYSSIGKMVDIPNIFNNAHDVFADLDKKKLFK